MPNTQQEVLPEEFDPHSAEYNADPHAYFKKYRDVCPIGHSSKHGGFWYSTTYDDLAQIMRDASTFSSAEGLLIGYPSGGAEFGTVKRLIPEAIDPPDLMDYRRLITVALSPQNVEALRPRIRQLTTHFIDQVIEKGECDLVLDVANPVPAVLTLEWLGFDPAEWKMFAMPMHEMSGSTPGTPEFEGAIAGILNFQQLIAETVADRRESPKDDFISFLVGSEIKGRPLSDEEIESMVYLGIAGGTETTTSLTASTFVLLDEQPELRAPLLADEELLKSATEEALRYFSPVKGNMRTVKRETAVSGCPMHPGEKVHAGWAAANRDPAQFEDPDTFKPERFPNRHVAFGMGPHRCLGSHLARSMHFEMVTQVLRRMPDYRIDRSALRSYPSQTAIGGWSSAPATFTPGPREG